MRKDKVKKVDFGERDANVTDVDVTLMHDDYEVTLPISQVIKNNKLLLKPGDKFTILHDYDGFEVAYLYNKHFYIRELPVYFREFISSLPVRDRGAFARALRKGLWRNGKVPSLCAYKNLRRIIEEHVAVQEKLLRQM